MNPFPSLTETKLADAVMAVDHYTGNIGHVLACRSVQDTRFSGKKVRFYQEVDALVANIHHELVLVDAGNVKGYRVVYWYLLGSETKNLSKTDAKENAVVKSAHNVGAWIMGHGGLSYALSAYPIEKEVKDLRFGTVKWTALTSGADVTAKTVVKDNITGMANWATKRKADAGPKK